MDLETTTRNGQSALRTWLGSRHGVQCVACGSRGVLHRAVADRRFYCLDCIRRIDQALGHPESHQTDVRYDASDGASYQARCTCGWSDWQFSRESAIFAADLHREQAAG